MRPLLERIVALEHPFDGGDRNPGERSGVSGSGVGARNEQRRAEDERRRVDAGGKWIRSGACRCGSEAVGTAAAIREPTGEEDGSEGAEQGSIGVDRRPTRGFERTGERQRIGVVVHAGGRKCGSLDALDLGAGCRLSGHDGTQVIGSETAVARQTWYCSYTADTLMPSVLAIGSKESMHWTDDPGGHLVLEPDRYPGAFRQCLSAGNLISVLLDETAEEWRSAWRTTVGWKPRREALIDVTDFSRSQAASGGASTTQMIPGHDVALTQMERPVDPQTVVGAVSEYLDANTDHDTLVYIDAVEELMEFADVDAVAAALEDLSAKLRDTDATGYFCLSPSSVDADVKDRLAAAVDTVEGAADPDGVTHALSRLRHDDPTNFGYVSRHWREAREGIESCSRNYPQSRQIHEAIDDPETNSRTLGATLQALVSLDVIGTWGETVGATRYDLTEYDPERLAAVGEELDESDGV